MLIHVGCEFVQVTSGPTHAVLQVEPRADAPLHVVEAMWDERTPIASSVYTDGFGNSCRRITLPEGRSTIRYDARVETPDEPDAADDGAIEIPPELLPHDVLRYTLPSRYCPSDEMEQVATDLFGDGRHGWARVRAVSDWVHENVTFGYGTSTPTTDALDVFHSREGVCRDFTHLAITLLRALGVPARYAFGYLPEIDVEPTGLPPDFAAWMEVYVGDQWWTFDPRNGGRRKGRVLIGRGLDALDVAMVSAFGRADLESMTVWADLETDPDPDPLTPGTGATPEPA
ncbi:MAG: transglutaminase family protein [Actinomycetota bacterium]|nr:transglutaminase family protein [Actinomycetota bacterium]